MSITDVSHDNFNNKLEIVIQKLSYLAKQYGLSFRKTTHYHEDVKYPAWEIGKRCHIFLFTKYVWWCSGAFEKGIIQYKGQQWKSLAIESSQIWLELTPMKQLRLKVEK